MKFRAVMIDSIPMREFNNVVTAVSKISKECVIKLSCSSVSLIVCDEGGVVGSVVPPKVWCHMDQTSFFSEYNMEGVDQQHRDIYLTLQTGNLARAVSSLKQNARSIKIKLTNKQYPCLSLEIELPSSNMLHTRNLTHDVPVTVVPRKYWSNYNQPTVEDYHISLEMPSLKRLHAIVERMKAMSPEVIIKANSSGDLILQIRTDLAVVSSRWRNLNVLNFDDNLATSDEADHRDAGYVVCHIDIRKFSMVLNAEQVSHNRVVCSMSHHKLLTMFIDQQGVFTFHTHIPALLY